MKSVYLLVLFGWILLFSCTPVVPSTEIITETNKIFTSTTTLTGTKPPSSTPRPSQTSTPSQTPYPHPYGGGTGVFLILKNQELSLFDSNKATSQSLLGSVSSFAWSPDGRNIAVFSRGGSEFEGLYILHLEDGRKTLVDNRTTITRLKWLPDGSALAYLVPSHAGQGFRKDLIVHWLDGSSPLYLHSHTDHTGYGTQFGMQIGAIDFAFTPDLSAVYFSGIYSGGSSSYIYRIRGSNWSQLPVRVTDSFEGGVDSLSWSPDGTQMSAVICEEGNIYLYEPDGKDLTKVSDFPAGQTGGVCLMTLEWTLDSQGIVFFRNGSIYRINKDGTNLKQLTGAVSSGFYQYPTISPDGKLIAYSASTKNGKEIYLMDLNGENVFKLSDGDSAAWQPGTP